MEENTISLDEFNSAWDDDYQTTETEEEATEESTNTETDNLDEAAEAPEGEETSSEENTQGGEENGAEEKPAPEKPTTEQMFTIKVNKEERTVGLEEMTALAQKGADYDRVKEQLGESRKQLDTLREDMEGKQNAIDVLEMIAKVAGKPLDETVKVLHRNFLISQGMSEREADAEIRAVTAEKRAASYEDREADEKSAEDENQKRIEAEVSDFSKSFPDVELTDEIFEKMSADIENGVSLTNAYLRYQNASLTAELAEAQRKLEAEKQNEKNKATSPGSQKDSGGKRGKSDYNDFMSAFT